MEELMLDVYVNGELFQENLKLSYKLRERSMTEEVWKSRTMKGFEEQLLSVLSEKGDGYTIENFFYTSDKEIIADLISDIKIADNKAVNISGPPIIDAPISDISYPDYFKYKHKYIACVDKKIRIRSVPLFYRGTCLLNKFDKSPSFTLDPPNSIPDGLSLGSDDGCISGTLTTDLSGGNIPVKIKATFDGGPELFAEVIIIDGHTFKSKFFRDEEVLCDDKDPEFINIKKLIEESVTLKLNSILDLMGAERKLTESIVIDAPTESQLVDKKDFKLISTLTNIFILAANKKAKDIGEEAKNELAKDKNVTDYDLGRAFGAAKEQFLDKLKKDVKDSITSIEVLSERIITDVDNNVHTNDWKLSFKLSDLCLMLYNAQNNYFDNNEYDADAKEIIDMMSNTLTDLCLPDLQKIVDIHIQKMYEELIKTGWQKDSFIKVIEWREIRGKETDKDLRNFIQARTIDGKIRADPPPQFLPPEIRLASAFANFALTQRVQYADETFLCSFTKNYKELHEKKIPGNPNVESAKKKQAKEEAKTLFSVTEKIRNCRNKLSHNVRIWAQNHFHSFFDDMLEVAIDLAVLLNDELSKMDSTKMKELYCGLLLDDEGMKSKIEEIEKKFKEAHKKAYVFYPAKYGSIDQWIKHTSVMKILSPSQEQAMMFLNNSRHKGKITSFEATAGEDIYIYMMF